MKIIKAFLFIILAIFITATLGFTPIINTEDKIYENPSRQIQTSLKVPVDFMSGDDYLSSYSYITKPGDAVNFKLRDITIPRIMDIAGEALSVLS